MGLEKNTEKVSSKEGNSIPDFKTPEKLGEIKDRVRVSNTEQLRIQKDAAADSGRVHELVTGTNTRVSSNAANGTTVTRRDALGPQK
jgi:hypothetical protein